MGESKKTYNMIEFVHALRLNFYDGSKSARFRFALVVEKYPIKRNNDWCCKVLAIFFKIGRTIYYDQLQEKGLLYVNVTENDRRQMGIRKDPWFIVVNDSKIKSFRGNEFIDYSFNNASEKDLKFVEEMRTKYNIVPPEFDEI